jgi:hypothetical protein
VGAARTARAGLVCFSLLLLSGCERGCARRWLAERGVGDDPAHPSGAPSLSAIDCPDGLARCREGLVEVSLLATIAQPCHGSPEHCQCPWEEVSTCRRGCVADGVEVVLGRETAGVQLCWTTPPPVVAEPPPPDAVATGCDEGDVYRCVRGLVVACHDNAVAARCIRGCAVEGTALGDEVPIPREAAFAILCSR